MKIDYLEIGAVGPYPGVHKIDFSQLGESALFLIDGPTGAGKTTIIDAIVFALFGGDQKEEAQADKFKLRSNHAKPETETYVILRFTVSAGTFEVRRTPQYKKLKVDGSTTPHNATCTVDRINPGGSRDNLANQVKAAATELQKLVGLEREQFRQTVVLPQGEFAKFLTSDSNERRTILQRIFATERYTKIEEELKNLSKSAREAVDSLKTQVHASIDTFKGRMHLPDEFSDQLKTLADSAESTKIVEAELAEITSILQASFEASKTKADDLKAKHDEAVARLDLRKKEHAAEEVLTQAKFDLDQTQATLDEAVTEIVNNHNKALRDALIEPKALADVAQFGTSLESVSSAISGLQPALEAEGSVSESQEAANEILETLPAQELRLKELDEQIQTVLPKEIYTLEDAVNIARKSIEGREKIVEKIAAAEEVIELQKSVNILTDSLESQKALVQEATDLKNDADDSYDKLIRQRFDNFATELANQLVPGEPCSVCGSKEHPEPNKTANELISAEMLESEKKKVSRAEGNLTKAQKKLADCQSELDTALGKIKGRTATSDSDLAALEKELAEVDVKVQELAVAEDTLAAKRAELTSANDERASLTGEVTAKKTALENLENAIKLATAQVNNFKHEFQSVEERASALDDLKTAIQNLERLRGTIEQKQGALVAATTAREALANHEHFGMFEDAQTHADAIGGEYTAAQAELNEVSKKVETANNDVSAILRNLEAQIDKLNDSRALIKLNLLASGNNQDRLPLSTYVLTTLFEDVVDAANVRLAGMLEGRYSLVTSETAAAGNRRTGLDLVIHDARHDKDRLVSTLSGGERFCVSLALALGLAEIVQSNQGGISIDTLFIDEGFGTLDGSRLDDVMNVLSNLKKHGRTVGLISHVDSMKQQITEKITANPDLATGQSTLEVSWM